MIKIRKKGDLLQLKRDESIKEVYVAQRISKALVLALLTLFPNLERIYAPTSVVRLTSTRIRNALKRVGVEIVPTERPPGRPTKYDRKTLKLVVEKYRRGEPVSKISGELGIPLRTLYYILRKLGLRRKNTGL